MYLIHQILFFIALAALIGFLCGWWFGRCRCREGVIAAERDALKVQLAQGDGSVVADLRGQVARLSAEKVRWELERAAPPVAAGAMGLAAAPSAEDAAIDPNAAELRAKLAALEAEKALLAQDLEAARSGASDSDGLRTKITALEADLGAAKTKSGAADQELEGLRRQLAGLETDKTKLAADLAAARQQLSTQVDESPALRARIVALEGELAAAKASSASAAPFALASGMGAALAVSAAAEMSPEALEAAVLAEGAGVRPAAEPAPSDAKDDLKEIGGVGPKIETWLHDHGIHHFWQIAQMEPKHLAWLAANLPNFGGRVYRENWVAQAAQLARGEMTDAKKAYLEGKHS